MNITNISISNMSDFINVVNNEALGLYGVVILILFFVIGSVMLMRRYPPLTATYISLLLMFPAALVMSVLGLLTQTHLTIYIIIAALFAVIIYLNKREQYM